MPATPFTKLGLGPPLRTRPRCRGQAAPWCRTRPGIRASARASQQPQLSKHSHIDALTHFSNIHTDQYPRPHITPPNFQPVYYTSERVSKIMAPTVGTLTVVTCHNRGSDDDSFGVHYMLFILILIHTFSFTSFTFILLTRGVLPQVLPQRCFGFSFKITFITTVELGWRNCVDGF